MSVDATRWAWMQRDIRGIAKTVLLSLADRANEYHEAYPSTSRLAEDNGVSERSVFRALGKLKRTGKIKPVGTTAKGTIKYQLLGVQGREDHELLPPPKPAKKAADAATPTPPPAPTIEIDDDTKQAARVEFRGYDIDHLVVLWREWVASRIAKFGEKERPRHPQKAFLGWARKYAARNPATASPGAISDSDEITIPPTYLAAAQRCLAVVDQIGQTDLAEAFYAIPGRYVSELSVVTRDEQTAEIIKKREDLSATLLAEYGATRFVLAVAPAMVAAVFAKLKETGK